jgi:hypothetical protein
MKSQGERPLSGSTEGGMLLFKPWEKNNGAAP